MKSILLVEDEPDVRATIQELLEAENYRVFSAKDGKEGYDLALREIPDMILSDIKMPIINGIQMYEMLQKHDSFKHTPFIFLSAKVDLADIRQGMAVGADDYITKPFTIEDLLDAVKLRFKKKENIIKDFEELRESLVKRIPHELRTPLISILGFSEILSENIDSFSKDDIIKMVEQINKTGKQLHTIIEKYIFFAKLLSLENEKHLGKISQYSFLVEQFNLKYDLASILGKSDRIDSIQVEMETCTIAMDEANFNAIIRELLENAVKFSEAGTPIRIGGLISEGKYEVTVEDRGTGMAPESVEQIKSFCQFEPDRYLYSGVGLGLAIVKKIMELSNSTMEIKSKKGEGTIVKIIIPLA